MKNIKCVVMGVCGSGKTSVGIAIAKAFGGSFIDGDDLHPRANIIKMKNGIPLTDEDRQPWLVRVSDVFFSLENRSSSGVVVCSALRKQYRDIIRDGNQGLIFVHLHGSRDLVLERMSKRKGHYMKTEMVDSQFNTLEFPGSDENDVINVSIEGSLEEVTARAIEAIKEYIDAK